MLHRYQLHSNISYSIKYLNTQYDDIYKEKDNSI